ncbi:MAG TPA: sulfate adenylyltransferase subunit CysN [Acidisphaera sp.]|nr:sulfate adenylyltransferase subunit CysN [Acidisphaera sp.]
MSHLTALAATSAVAETASRSVSASILRFITCGSVDDGKSTLIGRLLTETGSVPDDQLDALASDSRRFGTQDGAVDYALLLDGLAAEREQGITIDVAYRYFATPRRSFIVADAPGHKQYTRNMATGASTSDLAVLLVDARRGVLTQTRRHALIASMLGIRHVVLAVNKMDLVGLVRGPFAAIEADFRRFADGLGVETIACIPISAKRGLNVAVRSAEMPWYHGPSLLSYLEEIETEEADAALPFRLPVQWVNRPSQDFRGYAGLIAAGTVRVGDRLLVQPAGLAASVARIVTADGDLPEAVAGDSVTLVLDDEIDVSRGDVLAAARHPATVADAVDASVLWVSERPLQPGQTYLLKSGAATVSARVDAPEEGIDVETGAHTRIDGLTLNEIGRVRVRLDRPIAVDPYATSRQTGGFVLIDRVTNETVAMGLVERAVAPRRAHEMPWRSLAKALSWRTTGTIVTVILAYLFTGKADIAAAIGGVEVVLKIGLFYLHERAWAHIRFGRSKA